MPIEIPISFINDLQQQCFYEQSRNQLLCGGFGSGKTYIDCLKVITLLTSFDQYRVLVARQEYKTLKQTSMKTFFKVCPPELYAPPAGRFNEQDGYLRLINGSEVIFVHLDEVNEEFLRGLEINACLLDQAEEISEGIADILSVRCGRWDRARPSKAILEANPRWPKKHLCFKCNKSIYDYKPNSCPHCGSTLTETKQYYVPTYFLSTCNPESETHWLYRHYHPDSLERKEGNYYLEFPSTENPSLDPETLKVMLSRDPSWVQRFVYGKWGIAEASIHRVLPDSILDVPIDFVKNLIKKATLFRVLDHGDAAPTCCLWIASWGGNYFVYREYYQPGKLISYHREQIAALSGDEKYIVNLADPAIFKKQSQKYGGFWCDADEYLDPNIDAPPIAFMPADNNELGTRNRLNELLSLDRWAKHPLNGLTPAPRLYFIKRSKEHNFGCENVITETKSQRRKKLGDLNGKPIYSDEREQVPDHAYDPLRYFVAFHASLAPETVKKQAPENSFEGQRMRFKMLKRTGHNYGLPCPLA